MEFGGCWSRCRFAGLHRCAIGLALLFAPTLSAQPAESPKVTAQLVSDHVAVRPGKLAWLGIRLTIEKGWHVYWDGLNDTGMPLTASFKASPRVLVGPLVWPAPTRYIVGDFQLDHIYKRDALILVPIAIPTDATPGSEIRVEANLEWLVCDETCLLETTSVSIRLPVVESQRAPERSKAWRLFQRARTRLPYSEGVTPSDASPDSPNPGDAIPVQITLRGQTLRVQGPKGAFIAFYPENDCQSPSDLIRDGASETGELLVNFEGQSPAKVRGLIEIRHDGKTTIRRVAFPPIEEDRQDPQKSNRDGQIETRDDTKKSS
jgi:DsbC/DsbD-like thiol-disulfide interchange protein